MTGRARRSRQEFGHGVGLVVGVSIVLFVGSNFIGNVGDIMGSAIASIGIQIAFYYTLAGVAVVVAYRRVLLKSVKNFLLIGLWPAVGAVTTKPAIIMIQTIVAAAPRRCGATPVERSTRSEVPAAPTPMPTARNDATTS